MFKDTTAFSSFSVDDLAAARHFYQDVLGITVAEKGYVIELELKGAGNIVVYPKDDHLPATFTVLNLNVPDVKAAVAALKVKGVDFEQYDLPGLKTDEHDIFHDESMGIHTAWFRDPAGNILSVMQST